MKVWTTWLGVMLLTGLAISAGAAELYSSGTKTWDSSTVNWGVAPGGGGTYDQASWNNATPDSAILEGTAGTVTLGGDITNSGIRFDVAGYTIATNDPAMRLTFANNSTIRCDVASAIIEPDIDGTTAIKLTGTGNGTLVGKTFGSPNVTKTGSGTWTWGGSPYGGGRSAGHVTINDGILKATGTIGLAYGRTLTLNSGGEFHYNAKNVVYSPDGNGRSWNLNGGKLDNSSGAPVLSTNWWMGISLNQDTMFIGSQGANSDLTLTVISIWTDGKRIGVSNALATLTINGHSYAGGLGQGRDFRVTKNGAGTLKLTGNIQYLGDTIVEEGTLAIGTSSFGTNGLLDSTSLWIAQGTMVNLEAGLNDTIEKLYIGGEECMAGTWGSRASTATYRWNDYFQGTGILTVTSGQGLVPIQKGTVLVVF